VVESVAAVGHLDPLGPKLGRAGPLRRGLAHADRRPLGNQDARGRGARHAGTDDDRLLTVEHAHHSSPSPPRLMKSV
jgi:hypothetical protein